MFRNSMKPSPGWKRIDTLLMNPEVLSDRRRLMDVKSSTGRHWFQSCPRGRSSTLPARSSKKPASSWTIPRCGNGGRRDQARLGEQIPELEGAAGSSDFRLDPYEGRDITSRFVPVLVVMKALFAAADSFRMYSRYADSHRWKVEVLERSEITVVALPESRRWGSRRSSAR